MANVTIPNLTSATTIAPSTDLMVLEQTEGTRKATLSQIFTSSATSGSGLGITSGGVYTIKSGLDSNISDINALLGNTSIASIGDGTVTGAISTLNSDLSNKMDLVPYNSNRTIKFRYMTGAFNPSQTGGILKYNLTYDNVIGIVPMILQTNSGLYLTMPTLMADGWQSTINSSVNATIVWGAIVFYTSN